MKLSSNQKKVLSKMRPGRDYTIKELHCMYQTMFGLYVKDLVVQTNQGLLPSIKYGRFRKK